MNLKMALLPLAGALALLATACSGDGDTYVQTGNAPVTGINAIGTGEAIGEPDVMVLNIGVSAQRTTIAEAREAAGAAQAGVIAALKQNGVADKDIQTVQFNISPQYDFSGVRGQGQIIGYVVSNVVTAKVRDLSKASAAVDAATEAGGNDAVVQGLWFGIDDPTELQKQAREQAVDKAREQAQQLADNAGAKLGKLLSISETSGNIPYGRDAAFPTGGLAGTDVQNPTPVESGELTVTVTVNVLYAVD
ncbi:MAG TPA: SIMPL domain-containing protein [Dehalococcoidia bacterium]|jgi:hypothetical protein|nr:SIMPL domain-containing protein [Dehalococcoidia bacterium]